jgi:hypothetical protein
MTATISDSWSGRAEKWWITPELDLVWYSMKKYRVQGRGYMCGERFEVTGADEMKGTGLADKSRNSQRAPHSQQSSYHLRRNPSWRGNPASSPSVPLFNLSTCPGQNLCARRSDIPLRTLMKSQKMIASLITQFQTSCALYVKNPWQSIQAIRMQPPNSSYHPLPLTTF